MIDPVLASQTATEKGTRIVKKGNEMDKNAFLKILVAELTNQDPTNTKDSTAFVSQLAQFSSLEQMSNLNSTMTFNSASSLVGKTVALNAYDENNKQYGGVVRDVTKEGDNIKVIVNVADYKGDTLVGYEDKEFSYEDISSVLDIPSEDSQTLAYLHNTINYLNNNMSFMAASSLVNKEVEVVTGTGEETSTYSGVVKEAFRTSEGIKITLDLQDGTEKEFFYNEVVAVK